MFLVISVQTKQQLLFSKNIHYNKMTKSDHYLEQTISSKNGIQPS